MSILNFNVNTPTFKFKGTQGFEYRTLEELYKANGKEQEYLVNGLYVNDNSKFGKSPLIVGSSEYINLPNHMVSQIEEIRNTESIVEDINNGKVGFRIYEYHQKAYNKICYSIEWVEMKEDNPFTE